MIFSRSGRRRGGGLRGDAKRVRESVVGNGDEPVVFSNKVQGG